MYKAEKVDTNKALEYISENIKFQKQEETLEVAKIQQYYKGVQDGLHIAESIFTGPNFEKEEELSFVDGVLSTIYELGKELDIPTKDLICSAFARRIKDEFKITGGNSQLLVFE